VLELVPTSRGKPKDFGYELRLKPQTIKDLHRCALLDIWSCAGQFRDWPVKIVGSPHQPPPGEHVQGLVEEMCNRANEGDWDSVYTAAFLLWKINWIHPFGGGNGRTSRAVTQLALCVRLGFLPPGRPTLAEYIDTNRKRYVDALRDADRAWGESSVIDVGQMESMLNDLLEVQLASVSEPS
jgi:Fic family protein